MRFLAAEVREFARLTHPFGMALDQQGLVLVEGKNYDNGDAFDSNGAGKSMLFEAIKWCLFGKMSRYGDERLGSEEVCYNGHGASVDVFFESKRGTFRVRRERALKGSLKLSIAARDGDKWIALTGSGVHADEGTESVISLLGFDYMTLRYALTLEGTSLDIASEGFAAQMKILESILRFDIYTEAAKIAKAKEGEAQTGISRVVSEMERQEMILQQARGTQQEFESLAETERRDELQNVIVPALREQCKGKEQLVAREKKLRAVAILAQQHAEEKWFEFEHQGKHVAGLRNLSTGAEAEGTTVCETCDRPLTREDAESILSVAEEKLAALEVAYNPVSQARNNALDAAEKAEAEVKALEEKADALDDAERELKDIKQREDKRLKMITAQSQRAQDAESALATMTEEVATLRRRANTITFWARRGFSDLKQRTLSAATPILNEAAQRYGQILSDGAIQVEFDTFRESKGDRLIRASGETGPTYESMSNGEKRRASLIAALALRALARWRIAEPINFAVWDEVFDPLDDSGIRRAMEVLQQDQDELSSVFVITHSPVLKALFPGAKTITVVREHGESRVEA